jgi:hypothetical protein
MKFVALEGCRDQGVPERTRPQKVGEQTIYIPITYNYHRERVYDIDETQVFHLIRVGLFPEYFGPADDLTKDWVERNNDRIFAAVDKRELPYRKMTAEEEENDLLIRQGKKEGKYTLPQGPDTSRRIVIRPKIQRKGDPASSDVQDPALVEAPVRKGMSPEARKAAGERLAKARAAKRAAVSAGA